VGRDCLANAVNKTGTLSPFRRRLRNLNDVLRGPCGPAGLFAGDRMLTVPGNELTDYLERALPPSGWLAIDQARIDAFADATLDHQFIHVDREKAESTPFGRTIAHGYLTMSLISYFAGECGIRPENTVMAINYGSDKVRFLQPVKVENRIRAHAVLKGVEEKNPGQILLRTRFTIEIEGEDKPAMVADILSLFFIA
jgi:acyl dehydratase